MNVLGVDLGGAGDPSALSVLNDDGNLIALEQLPLGWRFKDQQRRIVQIADHVAKQGPVAIVVDATGLGRPQVEALRDRTNHSVVGVTITAGTSVTGTPRDLRVPKRDLISALSIAIEQGRLQRPASLKLADVIQHELSSYRFKVTAHGNETYGNGTGRGDSDHDDLVLSLALARWYWDRTSFGFEFAFPHESITEPEPLTLASARLGATTEW